MNEQRSGAATISKQRDIVPIGTSTEAGRIVGVRTYNGERHYLVMDSMGCVAELAACIVESDTLPTTANCTVGAEYYKFTSQLEDFGGTVEVSTIKASDAAKALLDPHVESCGITDVLSGADALFGFCPDDARFLD